MDCAWPQIYLRVLQKSHTVNEDQLKIAEMGNWKYNYN